MRNAILSLTIFLLVVSLVVIRVLAVDIYRIPSRSMLPNLAPGDFVLINKQGYNNKSFYGIPIQSKAPSVDVEYGQVLVFKYPPNPEIHYIFRVVGLPGDSVTISEGNFILNDEVVPTEFLRSDGSTTVFLETIEKATHEIQRHNSLNTSPAVNFTVPDMHAFVMGDNRDRTNDSRYWGFLPYENIIGILGSTIKTSKLRQEK